MTQLLPIFLDLASRSILLIGGGLVAREKLVKLLATGAELKIIAAKIHPETKVLIDQHRIGYEERRFEASDLDGVQLIISAVNEPEASRAIAQLARARGILINAVDLPLDSDFYFAAQIERGPLQIAISTRGIFPGVARALRLWLEEIFPPGVAPELEELGRIRQTLKNKIPDIQERMQALREQLEIWQRSPVVKPLETLIHPSGATI